MSEDDHESPLPEPPEHLSESEREAWRSGAAAMARVLGSHAMTLAGGLEGPPAPDEDDEPEECPECGADLVEAFGGKRCMACDYQEE